MCLLLAILAGSLSSAGSSAPCGQILEGPEGVSTTDRVRHEEGLGRNGKSMVLTLSVLPFRSPFHSLFRAHPGRYLEFIRNGGVRRGPRGTFTVWIYSKVSPGGLPARPIQVTFFLFLAVDSITDAPFRLHFLASMLASFSCIICCPLTSFFIYLFLFCSRILLMFCFSH